MGGSGNGGCGGGGGGGDGNGDGSYASKGYNHRSSSHRKDLG